MSIETMNAKAGPYVVDSGQSSFPFEFNALDSSYVAVYVDSALILSGGYSVALNGSSGGTVTFPASALESGGVLSSGAKVAIIRNVPPTQLTDLQNNTRFLPEVIEDALDKQTALIQQTQESAFSTGWWCPRRTIGETLIIFPNKDSVVSRP